MTTTELGTFSFTYRSLGVHGVGLSSSSNFAVLYEASQLHLKGGPPLSLDRVAAAALRFERRLASGGAVAADDVYPITYGGVLKVLTDPVHPDDPAGRDGRVDIEHVAYDPRWIAEHVVIAFDPRGERHDVPNLLTRLFEHPLAGSYVAQFSQYADAACEAISKEDVQKLAETIRKYRTELDVWMQGDYTRNVSTVADRLVNRLRTPGVEWKPPGGGASRSLMVVVPDHQARDAALELFNRLFRE